MSRWIRPPTVTAENINETAVDLGASIQFNATVSDSFSTVSEVLFTVLYPNNSSENLTATESSPDYWTTTFTTAQRGLYNWTKTYATSVGGTNKSTPALTFDVYGTTRLTQPQIDNATPLRTTTALLQSQLYNSSSDAIANQAVTFLYGTTSIGSNVTVGSGLVKYYWTIPLSLGTGPYTLNASYAQNDTAYYRTSNNDTGTFTVYAGTQVLDVALNDSNILRGDNVLISANLRYDNLSTLSNQEISFSYNGTLIGTDVTDAAGSASIVWDTSAVPIATYTIQVTYAENTSIYTRASSNTSVSATVQSVYGVLTPTLVQPSSGINISEQANFTLNASVTCTGSPEQNCGTVQGVARYVNTSIDWWNSSWEE